MFPLESVTVTLPWKIPPLMSPSQETSPVKTVVGFPSVWSMALVAFTESK